MSIEVRLPKKPFMYTLDQVAEILSLPLATLKKSYIWYDGRELGVFKPREKMKATNIAPTGETPEWRVSESNLILWMKSKGIRFHERGWWT